MTTTTPGLIRLFCIRHGERVDFAFGPSWAETAFDKSGIVTDFSLSLLTVSNHMNYFRKISSYEFEYANDFTSSSKSIP